MTVAHSSLDISRFHVNMHHSRPGLENENDAAGLSNGNRNTKYDNYDLCLEFVFACLKCLKQLINRFM